MSRFLIAAAVTAMFTACGGEPAAPETTPPVEAPPAEAAPAGAPPPPKALPLVAPLAPLLRPPRATTRSPPPRWLPRSPPRLRALPLRPPALPRLRPPRPLRAALVADPRR